MLKNGSEMHRKIVNSFLTVSLLLFATGCSSLMNVSGNYFAFGPTDQFSKPPPKRVYGGVRLASQMGWDYTHYKSQDGAELFAVPYGIGIWAIDMPLSAVGDTLTLPVTIPAALERSIHDYYFPNRPNLDDTPVKAGGLHQSQPMASLDQ
jgi:uncharacterized protein YceK